MFSALSLLFIGLVVEAVGLVLLSRGMKSIDRLAVDTLPEILRSGWKVASSGKVIVGVVLQASYFVILVSMLSWADLSFVLPLSAFGYLIQTTLAVIFLKEKVTSLRWSGIVIVVVGVFLISMSYRH